MLIATDIGNSLIHIGFFTVPGLIVQEIDTHPLLSPSRYLEFFNRFIKEKSIDKIFGGIIISSVVPGHTGVLGKALKRLSGIEPLIVSCSIKTGLTLNILNPDELGSDRIASAVAAYERYKCSVAVLDFGTATTINVVREDANYVGGAIMPGINLMNESLAKGTSKLSKVQINIPQSALGIDTVTCIQSGLLYGTAGAVEKILSEIEEESNISLKVIVTGGYGRLISRFLKRKHEVLPYLTLEGLKILYQRNKDA